MKREHKGISVWIDKLTDSIVEVKSGKRFDTEMSPLTKDDLKQITKKTFVFPWKKMFKEHTDWEFYKLNIKGDTIIQGLIPMGKIDDNTFFVFDAESARFNVPKFNRGIKLYNGVGGNLFAFACKTSMERGYYGYVGFDSKTELIEHYNKEMGAKVVRGRRMEIGIDAAKILINKYYKS